eukprot:6445862-Pyramimonas_sp.AAC.1
MGLQGRPCRNASFLDLREIHDVLSPTSAVLHRRPLSEFASRKLAPWPPAPGFAALKPDLRT